MTSSVNENENENRIEHIENAESEELIENTESSEEAITTNELTPRKGLSANQLKWIAIICMLIDHFTWVFIPTKSILGQVLHIIGRVTAPIMFFFIAEGYEKTNNFNKYALRLAIFGVISFAPYMLAFYNRLFIPNPNIILLVTVFFATFYKFKMNILGVARCLLCGMALIPISKLSFAQPNFLNMGVIYTLFLGLISLRVIKSNMHLILKIPITIFLLYMTQYGDWAIVGMFAIWIFSFNKGNYKKQLILHTLNFFMLMYYYVILPNYIQFPQNKYELEYVINILKWNIFHIGVFIPLILLCFYNGQRSNNENQTELSKNINKWAFYIIYPAHLVLIYFIK